MPRVTRRIHIAAPPDVVRRHVTDPQRRRRWLDLDVDPTTHDDGTVTFDRGDDESSVRIAIVPDGDGAEVTVTEDAPAHDVPVRDIPADDTPDDQPTAFVGRHLGPRAEVGTDAWAVAA